MCILIYTHIGNMHIYTYYNVHNVLLHRNMCGSHLFSKTIIFMLRLLSLRFRDFRISRRFTPHSTKVDYAVGMWGLGSSPSDTRRGLCAATRAWMGLAPITGVLCTFLHIPDISRYFQMHYDHNQIISSYCTSIFCGFLCLGALGTVGAVIDSWRNSWQPAPWNSPWLRRPGLTMTRRCGIDVVSALRSACHQLHLPIWQAGYWTVQHPP